MSRILCNLYLLLLFLWRWLKMMAMAMAMAICKITWMARKNHDIFGMENCKNAKKKHSIFFSIHGQAFSISQWFWCLSSFCQFISALFRFDSIFPGRINSVWMICCWRVIAPLARSLVFFSTEWKAKSYRKIGQLLFWQFSYYFNSNVNLAKEI